MIIVINPITRGTIIRIINSCAYTVIPFARNNWIDTSQMCEVLRFITFSLNNVGARLPLRE